MTRHELKCHPDFFAAILSGEKTHETRFNDRGYQVGDELVLKEFSPDTGFTGREVVREVTYIAYASAMTPVAEGYVVMSLADGCPHGTPWSRDCEKCEAESEDLKTRLRPALLADLVNRLELDAVVGNLAEQITTAHLDGEKRQADEGEDVACFLRRLHREDVMGALAPVLSLIDEARKLVVLINTPEVEDFDKAVPREAAHQVLRWGVAHDAIKEPQHWVDLIGWLAEKAARALNDGDVEKAKHHAITAAAAARNWHAHIRTTRFGYAECEKLHWAEIGVSATEFFKGEGVSPRTALLDAVLKVREHFATKEQAA